MPDRTPPPITIRDTQNPWPDRVSATTCPKAEQSLDRSRELRQNMSPPEVILWQRLRRHQLLGLKFRRQHVLGPYFADFYCHELRLVVEIDGEWEHRARRDKDARRDAWMHAQGLTVLRISAFCVFDDVGAAVAIIRRKAIEIAPELAARVATSEHSREQGND